MSTNKDKQIAQLSAQVIALTALVAKTIEQQQAPATKGQAKKAAAEPRAGNAWSAFSGALSRRVTALIKEGYADDARWESEKGAEDGCKRAGFQMRVAGYLKAGADDGEGGYTEPDEDDIVLAVEYILDNPKHQTPTAESRGGMSVTQLKAAGLKVAKPVAKPAPVKKPAAAPAPAPVKKAKVKVPEPESDEEEEPAPAPVKKAAPPKGKGAVAAAAAAVAAVAPADEPDADELAAAGLKAMPKSTNLRHVDTKMIYASMAEFKKGISIGIWGKGADGKMGIQPNQAPSNAAAAPASAPAPVAEEAEEAEEEDI
jgi:hypothetical protein